jgi:hypothetical protein
MGNHNNLYLHILPLYRRTLCNSKKKSKQVLAAFLAANPAAAALASNKKRNEAEGDPMAPDNIPTPVINSNINPVDALSPNTILAAPVIILDENANATPPPNQPNKDSDADMSEGDEGDDDEDEEMKNVAACNVCRLEIVK